MCNQGSGARAQAEAVEVLDLLLKFFSDGERWVKGRLRDRRGNRSPDRVFQPRARGWARLAGFSQGGNSIGFFRNPGLWAHIAAWLPATAYVLFLFCANCPPPEAPIWISRLMRIPSQRVCLASRSD